MLRTIIVWIFALLLVAGAVSAEIPRTMSYQGVLLNADGSQAADSTYSVTFRLFDVDSGGAHIWLEVNPVTTESGIFNVILGKTAPLHLDFDRTYWLEIEIDGSVLTPRTELSPSPYTFRAAVSDSASKAAHADVADSARAVGEYSDADWTISGDNIYRESGSVGIGTDDPKAALHLNGNCLWLSGGGYGGGLPGAGPGMWLSYNEVKDCGIIFGWDYGTSETKDVYIQPEVSSPATPGGNIGIGVLATEALNDIVTIGGANGKGLTIQGDAGDASPYLTFENPDNADVSIITPRDGRAFDFEYGVNNQLLSIDTAGNVGIGTVSPVQTLDVEGDVRFGGQVGIGTSEPTRALDVLGPVYVNHSWSNYHGLQIQNSGGHGVLVTDSPDNAFHVADAGGDGINVLGAGDCGIDARGDHGNHLRVNHNAYHALVVHSWFDEIDKPGLYVHGTFTATGAKASVIETSEGKQGLYCIEGPDVEFMMSGTGRLVSGEATVATQPVFQEGVSSGVPVKVIVTPVGSWSGLYVTGESPAGFTVRSDAGDPNATFTWLMIGRRKGYETRPLLFPVKD